MRNGPIIWIAGERSGTGPRQQEANYRATYLSISSQIAKAWYQAIADKLLYEHASEVASLRAIRLLQVLSGDYPDGGLALPDTLPDHIPEIPVGIPANMVTRDLIWLLQGHELMLLTMNGVRLSKIFCQPLPCLGKQE